MSEDWNTKYGTRRVRRDPPTLDEAIFAAIGITDDLEAQAENAASLMGMPLEAVLAEVETVPHPLGTGENISGQPVLPKPDIRSHIRQYARLKFTIARAASIAPGI